MFHGSAPVVSWPLTPTLLSTTALNEPRAGLLILITVTLLPAALAT